MHLLLKWVTNKEWMASWKLEWRHMGRSWRIWRQNNSINGKSTKLSIGHRWEIRESLVQQSRDHGNVVHFFPFRTSSGLLEPELNLASAHGLQLVWVIHVPGFWKLLQSPLCLWLHLYIFTNFPLMGTLLGLPGWCCYVCQLYGFVGKITQVSWLPVQVM